MVGKNNNLKFSEIKEMSKTLLVHHIFRFRDRNAHKAYSAAIVLKAANTVLKELLVMVNIQIIIKQTKVFPQLYGALECKAHCLAV